MLVRIVDRMESAPTSREATHWPECYLWYHSCAHAVVEMQKTKIIISAVQHHSLVVQDTELVINIASYYIIRVEMPKMVADN